MKGLKSFKILFRYFKHDKLKLFTYILFTIIKYFEPLLNTFMWANALQALFDRKQELFFKYLILWSLVHIITWVFVQLPGDLIFNHLEKKFMENINKDLYSKVLDLPAVAFEDIGTGEFINRMYSDPDRILELLSKLIKLSCRLIVAIIIVIVSFTISWVVGIELLVLAFIMFIMANIYYPKIKKLQENIKKETDKYLKVATQDITGIREIKALGIKNIVYDNISNILTRLFNNQRHLGVVESFYYGINNLLYYLLQFLILFTLGKQMFSGVITMASFIVIDKYIWRIDDVVEGLSEFGIAYNKIVVSLKRIDELLNNVLYKDEKYGNKVINIDKVDVEFKNVYFKYRKDDNDLVLKGLNMKVEANKKVAIVGSSGGGKSTIFNLLLRYFDNSKGIIRIGGTNIKKLKEEALRECISVIRQSPYLFNNTILENFRMVKPDVTLKEVREVCKKAYIDKYIMSLPDKYDTLIGEGGVSLAGGQKQRIAIARTLLKNTKIILFDEATSALDNESQEYIKKTIDDLVKTHTIIIVAHRLSTIIDADLIYVINNGKVDSYGTHEELIKNSKTYKKLYSPEVLDI